MVAGIVQPGAEAMSGANPSAVSPAAVPALTHPYADVEPNPEVEVEVEGVPEVEVETVDARLCSAPAAAPLAGAETTSAASVT